MIETAAPSVMRSNAPVLGLICVGAEKQLRMLLMDGVGTCQPVLDT
ncbi:MAG: hypothetical protein AABY83_06755 [Pseudomonadota bacterium]